MIETKTIEVKPIVTPTDRDYSRTVKSSNSALGVDSSYQLTTADAGLSDTESTFSDIYETDPIHMKLINVNEFRYDLLTLVWDKTDYTITRDVINKHVVLHVVPLGNKPYASKPIKIADIIYPLNINIRITTEEPYTVTHLEDVNMAVVAAEQSLDYNTQYDILLNFENLDEARLDYLEEQVSYLPWNNVVTELPEASEAYRGRCMVLTSGHSDALYCCILMSGIYVWMPIGNTDTLTTSELGLATLGLCILGDGIDAI